MQSRCEDRRLERGFLQAAVRVALPSRSATFRPVDRSDGFASLSMFNVTPRATTLSPFGASRLVNEMRRSHEAIIELDCRELGWIEPFGMLLTICCADSLREQGKNVVAINTDQNGYAWHMGLLDGLDTSISAPASIRRASDRYVSVTRLSKGWLEAKATSRGGSVQDYVYEYAWELACLLTQKTDKDSTNQTLQFCLAEILRNSYEHSASSEILLCGQFWPSMNRVDLAVADKGIGIAASLAANPYVRCATDAEAISASMLPGISGVAFQGSTRTLGTNVDWENSGYGLWLTSRICREFGSITICSGTACCRFASANSVFRTQHNGTVLGLTIDPTRLHSFDDSLRSFNSEGRKLAKRLPGAIV